MFEEDGGVFFASSEVVGMRIISCGLREFFWFGVFYRVWRVITIYGCDSVRWVWWF